MKRRTLIFPLVAGALALPAHAALVQPEPTASEVPGETTRPTRRLGPVAPKVALKITVVEVSGLVRYRKADDEPWVTPKVGDELEEGVEFNTGLRSFVRLQIGEDQICTLDRLGVVKVLRANVENGVIKTDAAMKYGRTNYQIEAAGREHEVTIRSATSTLAVRGTVVELFDQPPFVPQAVSYTGRAMFRDARRQVSVGSRGGRKVVLDGDKNSPAETALATTSFDPALSHARTPEEQRLIEQVIATGGQISFEQPFGIPIVRGGTPIQYNENSDFPGKGLNFVLNWTGDADLNLTVALPKFGDLITPVTNLNRGKTGGVTSYDHRGGPNGGFELVYFPTNYPGSMCVMLPNGDLAGTETYVTSIDFVSGNVADVSLKTFARDPVTGRMVYVSEISGSVNQSVADVNFSPNLTFNLINPPPCLPAGSIVQSVRGNQVLTGMLTADCGCPEEKPVAAAKNKGKKKPGR